MRSAIALTGPPRSRVTTMRAIYRRDERDRTDETTSHSRRHAMPRVMAAGGWGAASAHATTTCTWAGPRQSDWKVWYTGQGITNTPSTEPLPFIAHRPARGRLQRTLTYRGIQATDQPAHSSFEARVTGLHGVVRAAGDMPWTRPCPALPTSPQCRRFPSTPSPSPAAPRTEPRLHQLQ